MCTGTPVHCEQTIQRTRVRSYYEAWQQLEKKGFTAGAVGTAMAATAAMVQIEADRRQGLTDIARHVINTHLKPQASFLESNGIL